MDVQAVDLLLQLLVVCSGEKGVGGLQPFGSYSYRALGGLQDGYYAAPLVFRAQDIKQQDKSLMSWGPGSPTFDPFPFLCYPHRQQVIRKCVLTRVCF